MHPDALMWLETEHLLHGIRQIFGRETRITPYDRVPGKNVAVLILATNSTMALVYSGRTRYHGRICSA